MQMFKPDASGGGAVSSGSKNYLSAYNNNPGNGDFENASVSGWSLGTIGTLTNNLPTGSPTFGSGASGNLSLSLVSSGQLAALYSGSYASSAATTAGDMLASSAFTIDIEDQAKRLSWSFSYKAQTNPGNANWSGTSSNSLAVAFWDVTNSVWLTTNGQFSLIQSAGVGLATGTVQTQSNTLQVRMVVYNANATSGAVTVYFDDFVCGPSQIAGQSSVVSWAGAVGSGQSVTSNVTDITVTTIKDSSAAWNGSQYVVPIAGDYVFCGVVASSGSSVTAQIYKNGTALTSGSYFTTQAVSNGQGAGSILVPNCKPGDLLSIRSSVSGTISSAYLGIFLIGSQPGAGAGGVVAATLGLNSSQAVGGNAVIKYDTVVQDTTASYSTSTGIYTIPASGTYRISVVGTTSSASTNYYVKRNSSSDNYLMSGGTGIASGGIQLPFNAGDQVSIFSEVGATFQGIGTQGYVNSFAIALVQGTPATASFSAPVAAIITGNAGQSVTSSTDIAFATVVKDTNAAWNGTQYKAPISGFYTFIGSVATTGSATQTLQSYLNGVASYYVNDGGLSTGLHHISGMQYLNAGDLWSVRFDGGTNTLNNVANNHYITISMVK